MESFAIRILALQDKLHRFALFLTKNKEDADDLFQETVLKTLENKDKYVREGSLWGWSKTIMSNTFFSDRRHYLNHQKCFYLPNDEDKFDIPDENGMNDFFLRISLNELTNAIEKLQSTAEKKTISLFVAGYKYEEIADITKTKLGTVKSRLNKIKEKLTKELKD